jgi:hypothetical protein
MNHIQLTIYNSTSSSSLIPWRSGPIRSFLMTSRQAQPSWKVLGQCKDDLLDYYASKTIENRKGNWNQYSHEISTALYNCNQGHLVCVLNTMRYSSLWKIWRLCRKTILRDRGKHRSEKPTGMKIPHDFWPFPNKTNNSKQHEHLSMSMTCPPMLFSQFCTFYLAVVSVRSPPSCKAHHGNV